MSTPQFKPLLLGAVVPLVLAGVVRGDASFDALKKCLRDCIDTTPPGSWARAICGLDCLLNPPGPRGDLIRVDAGSTNYTPISVDPAYGYLNLIGVGAATVRVDVLGGPTPLSVRYLLFNDTPNPGDPFGAYVLGTGSDAAAGFPLNFAPAGEGYILAEAHFTSSPTEDINTGWPVYFSTQSIPEPVAAAVVSVLIWGRRSRRRVRIAR